MYKVFVDKSCLHFKKNEKFSTNVGNKFLPSLDPAELNEFAQYLKTSDDSCRYFINDPDPIKAMQRFFNRFNWIEAAGGIVEHEPTERYLFIYRNDRWDLPKGKVDKGETIQAAAIREVQEECGIKELRIIKPLPPSFHVYFAYEKFWIKRTSWFKMTTGEDQFSPELKEGITMVELFKPEEVPNLKAKTFHNLHQVIDEGILK